MAMPSTQVSTQTAGSQEATRVVVRLRPARANQSINTQGCITAGHGQGSLQFQGPDSSQASFQFDKVYGINSTQSEVFDDLAYVVDACLAGYNGAVLAYGNEQRQANSNLQIINDEFQPHLDLAAVTQVFLLLPWCDQVKQELGDISNPHKQGVVPRAITRLGQGIAAAACQQGALFTVRLSIVEIYCEKVRCLLDGCHGNGGSGGKDNLAIKTDPARGVYVAGATEVEVCGEEELAGLLSQGLAGRAVSATAMNSESSRSHCLVTIWVEQSLPNGEARVGKMVLVDLAGSERAGKTGAQGITLAEGALINKSLSCLANVIYALTDTNAAASTRHVPYRDSKLTRILQDSLGGTARTVLICCCSPDNDNAPETLSTLRFGARAKGLTCKVQINQRMSAEKLQQLLSREQDTTQALTAEVASLKAALAAAGVCSPSTGLLDVTDAPSARSSCDQVVEQAGSHDIAASEQQSITSGAVEKHGERNKQVMAIDVAMWLVMFLSIVLYWCLEDSLRAPGCLVMR